MAIEIRERFSVDAPIDVVWPFIKDPEQLVLCMPGASLEEVVDERTFVGSVKVKLGALTAKYKGKVEFADVDEENYSVRVVAEGREAGGGTARGTLASHLASLPDGSTEVVAEGDVDLTGRVMQVGRGMIQGVSEQLFQEFARSTKSRLELRDGAVGLPDGVEATPAGGEDNAIRVLPLLFRTLWSAIRKAYRRIRNWIARRTAKGVGTAETATEATRGQGARTEGTPRDDTNRDRQGSDN